MGTTLLDADISSLHTIRCLPNRMQVVVVGHLGRNVGSNPTFKLLTLASV